MSQRIFRQAFVKAALSISILLSSPAAIAEPLRIGLSLPLSGDISVLSKQFLDGARLAVNALAPDGEVELVEADDGCDPELAELAAEDLLNARVILITGYLCNTAAAAAANILQDEAVPMIVAGARGEYFLKDNRGKPLNSWRLSQGEGYAADASFRFLSQRWQSRPWAIVDDGTIYGRTLSEALRAKMEEDGQAPQLVETIRPGVSDMGPLVRRLRDAGVSAVFVAAGPVDVAAIWRETSQLDIPMEVAGGEALAQLPWTKEIEELGDGLLAIKLPEPHQLPGFAGLASQLADAGIAPEPHVYIGYAALEVAMAALRRTPQETTVALGDSVFRTVLGIVKFNIERVNQVNRYRMFELRDGKFQDPAEVVER